MNKKKAQEAITELQQAVAELAAEKFIYDGPPPIDLTTTELAVLPLDEDVDELLKRVERYAVKNGLDLDLLLKAESDE